jgi:uracil-DNA glycosylase
VGRDRGRPIDSDLADLVTVTTHPSAILRAPGEAQRHEAMDAFVEDLRRVADWLEERS